MRDNRLSVSVRRLRGHASYAYNRVVLCVTGDICKEVIEDPASKVQSQNFKFDAPHGCLVG